MPPLPTFLHIFNGGLAPLDCQCWIVPHGVLLPFVADRMRQFAILNWLNLWDDFITMPCYQARLRRTNWYPIRTNVTKQDASSVGLKAATHLGNNDFPAGNYFLAKGHLPPAHAGTVPILSNRTEKACDQNSP